MEPQTKESTPPTLRLDLSSPTFATLARFAARIAKLLSAPTVQADPNVAGTLDDFLGAVYALVFAKRGDFTDRTARSIDITAVQQRAVQIESGDLRPDGKWMAGFHFNSALFRIAAVYHRILKITVGRPTTRDDVPTLQTQAENLYCQWKQAEWSSGHVHLVHGQVNDLKHTPRGVHDLRKVTYQDALAAIGELLDLIEAWTGSRVPPTSTP